MVLRTRTTVLPRKRREPPDRRAPASTRERDSAGSGVCHRRRRQRRALRQPIVLGQLRHRLLPDEPVQFALLDCPGGAHCSIFLEPTEVPRRRWAAIPETVADESATSHASLARDSQNRPHVTLGTDSGVTYAFHDGDTWQFQVLDELGQISAVVIDDQDLPHIAYTRPGMPSVLPGLLYAHHDGQSWDIELVRTGQSLAMGSALDADGMPHISFNDFAFGRNLQYAVLVPEPGSLALLASSSVMLLIRSRRGR